MTFLSVIFNMLVVFLFFLFNRQCAVDCLEDVSKFLTVDSGQVAVSMLTVTVCST